MNSEDLKNLTDKIDQLNDDAAKQNKERAAADTPAHLVNIDNQMGCTGEAAEIIRDMFQYHQWDNDQTRRGNRVRAALAAAVEVIVDVVPPSPDRAAAIRKIREARMDCNSAITHRGRY